MPTQCHTNRILIIKEIMADSRFVKFRLQGESNGRIIDLKEIRVWRLTKVAQLKEYVIEVLCYKGTLYKDSKTKVYQSSTIAQLKIEDGDVLKLNKYLILNRSALRELVLLYEGERCIVQIPAKIKVQLLKFVIECELGIQIPQLVLRKDNQLWNPLDSHECSREDLQNLSVEDISKRVNTPLKDSPNTWGIKPSIMPFNVPNGPDSIQHGKC